MTLEKYINLIDKARHSPNKLGRTVFICLLSYDKDWKNICESYLKAFSIENNGDWKPGNGISSCFSVIEFYSKYNTIKSRLEMLDWLEGYLLTFEGMDL